MIARLGERRRIGLTLVLALIVWTALHFVVLPPGVFYSFEAEVATSSPGVVQVFYDPTGGAVWTEGNSAKLVISQANEFRQLQFSLPAGRYGVFRFDPIDREAETVSISGARIVKTRAGGFGQSVVQTFSASSFRAGRQIRTMSSVGDTLRLATMANASDPVLLIDLARPARLYAHDTVDEVVLAAGSLLIAFPISWLMTTLFRRNGEQWHRCWQRAQEWALAHPTRAITACALLASVLSCYPVVFFGKSFVSPDLGTPLLYDVPPYLPGYNSAGLEDAAASDVGALMWAHLSYTAVARRALVTDHELPLWNRFNAGGATLIGQGQAMLGDVLNLAVMLAGASSWAWDLKFVLAKALFAMAIGLSVFALTGNLGIALTLAASSTYIGFFNFRFNHPAIFSLSYSPWILYCWIRFTRLAAADRAGRVRWLTGLLFANWMVLNSGTIKEAYMLLIFMSLTGALMFLVWKEPLQHKLKKGVDAALALFAFTLISAPLWVQFLDALTKSFTYSDTRSVQQVVPSLFLGLFDDIFYRAQTPGEVKALPATNFLVLLGCLWAAARFRSLLKDRQFAVLGAATAIPLCLAFGVVPPNAILTVPFIANISHIHNTFSVVAIPLLMIFAGYGLNACLSRSDRAIWKVDLLFAFVVFAILIALYANVTLPVEKSQFANSYAASLIAAFVVMPFLLRALRRQASEPAVIVLLVFCMALLHWRHGMYGKTPYDKWVMNPPVRVSFDVNSDAVAAIRARPPNPFRVAGFGNNLFPGYGGQLGLEGFNGPDALVSRYYHEISQPTLDPGLTWRASIHKADLARLKPLYDFFNIGYYVAAPGDLGEVPGLDLEAHLDLNLYKSRAVWPRAYFTNHVITYRSATELAERILAESPRPFAAVDEGAVVSDAVIRRLVDSAEPTTVVPAERYRLTSNSTSFSVIAAGKGLIVLSEAYSEGDFSATVNGKRAPLLRVNHAFKGIVVDGPGIYKVRIWYWPRYLTESCVASAVGVVLLGALCLRSGALRS